jgi:diguanylate cyclase (GGDEF)-like protein
MNAAKSFDLILMDCHMPEMNGFEATEAIRKREQDEHLPRIPIIALTADVQKGINEECLDAGMDSYLSKPFNIQQLKSTLEQWLADHAEATPAEPVSQSLPSYKDLDMGINQEAWSMLRQIKTDSGETLLESAIKLFLESAPQAIGEIHTAFTTQDQALLVLSAHGFKSVCANLGISAMAECCAKIEHSAKQGELEHVPGALEQLQRLLPRAMDILVKELPDKRTDLLPVVDENAMRLPTQLTAARILLVDDDRSFRVITRQALAAAGFEVDEATSGEQALELIDRQRPDLVLLDALMDGLDGFETCRLMRARSGMTDVPIIMTTGLGDMDSINRSYEVGADDFAIKPLNYQITIHRLWFAIRASRDIAELRTNKIQLNAAQRIARLGYWTWNPERDQFSLSESLAALCEIELTEFKPELNGFIDLVHPDDRAQVRALLIDAAANDLQEREPSEYRLQINPFSSIYVVQELQALNEGGQCLLIGAVQDITHKKQAESQIYTLAYFDNLTGLASRTYYHERVAEYIRAANTYEYRFAFLFIDLDGFKGINDSFGHDVGDYYLKTIAERIKQVVRDIDFAARLGGDEFCIILDRLGDEELAGEIADRCLQKINQPLTINQQQIKPRASIGIAFFPRDGQSEVDLMKSADTAMYAAKQAGKQCYRFYSEEMTCMAISQLEKEQMLRDAFELEQFELYYQPQVSVETGKMVAVEALIRWQHPEKGLILPGEFVPLVEELGLIVRLGNWVLEQACRQILQWRATGVQDLRVAVNIAPVHFQDPSLLITINHLLVQTGGRGDYLELEVTESAMQDQGSLKVFDQLRAMGIKIAIDDFGTGYSCLASLKQLPLDYLKVDRIFVADVLTNTHTAFLLGTIIGLANALEYTVIAEGVELHEQALIMQSLGCHMLQGYLFSRPVCAEEIPALFNRNFTVSQDF